MKRVYPWILRRLGGRARARVIALLALVLALDSADVGAIGANAHVLQSAFGIDRGQVGLLLAFSSGVSALATLPFGWLVDRARRTKILAIAVLCWGIATLVSSFSSSYAFLLITRLFLGGLVAAALPSIASLTGDYFPQRERGEVYGYIISGELVGAGVGLLIAGELGAIWWRLSFWFLALPAPFIAWGLHRLPEPARNGSSRIQRGQEHLDEKNPEQHDDGEQRDDGRGDGPDGGEYGDGNHEQHRGDDGAQGLDGGEPQPRRFVGRKAKRAGHAPRERLLNESDPAQKSFLWAVGYVLSIPTNILLIIGSAFGYFFFAAIRAFGVEFWNERYGVSHTVAIVLVAVLGAGALVGVYAGGNLADWLLRKGHLRGRAWVTTVSYTTSAALFVAGPLVPPMWLAAVVFFLASVALGGINPPLDAARLDIMHPHLWGRAEAVRTTLRKAAEAVAPWLLGLLAGSMSVRDAFLWASIPLCVGAMVSLFSLRTYLRDAATADAFTERTVH